MAAFRWLLHLLISSVSSVWLLWCFEVLGLVTEHVFQLQQGQPQPRTLLCPLFLLYLKKWHGELAFKNMLILIFVVHFCCFSCVLPMCRLWAGNQHHVRSQHSGIGLHRGWKPHSHQWLHRQNSWLDPQQPVLTRRHCAGTGYTTGRALHINTHTASNRRDTCWTFCHVFWFAAGWNAFVSDSDEPDQRPDRAAELQPETQLWPMELIQEKPKSDEDNRKHVDTSIIGVDW